MPQSLRSRFFFHAALLLTLVSLAFPRLSASAQTPPAPTDSKSPWRAVGTVLDAQNKPVKNAKVSGLHGQKIRIETQADNAGKFELNIPADSKFVAIAATDPQTGDIGYSFAVKGQLVKPTDLKVSLQPSMDVTITVVDAQGKPVEDATVIAIQRSFQLDLKKTDNQGLVQFRLVKDFLHTQIHALKPGLGYDYFSAQTLNHSPNPLTSNLKFTLNGTRSFTAKLIDTQNKPLSNITLYVPQLHRKGNPAYSMLPPELMEATTDANGIVRFDTIPSDVDYPISLQLSHKHFGQDIFGRHDLDIDVRSPNSEYTFTIRRSSTISGQILRPDGTPAKQLPLIINGLGANLRTTNGGAQTDDQGRFEANLPSDAAYVLYASVDNLYAQQVGIVLREGKPVRDIQLKLAPGTVITGIVTRGKDNQPVPKQAISLQSQFGPLPDEIQQLATTSERKYRPNLFCHHFAITGEDGRYRIVLGPGNHVLSSPTREDRPATIKITNETEIVRNFNLPRQDSIPFSGLVLDPQGKPVPNAIITGRYVPKVWTARQLDLKAQPDGKFTSKRDSLPIWVHIESPDHRLALVTRLDTDTNPPTYNLQPLSTFRGRLLDPDGNPKPNAPVVSKYDLLYGEKGGMMTYVAENTVHTDAQGRYQLPGLAVGAEWTISHEFPQHRHHTLGKILLTKVGDVDLGDTKLPKPYVPPTEDEKIARRFRIGKPLADRFDKVKHDAKHEDLRPLLVLADPKSDLAKQLNTAFEDFENQDFTRSRADYEPLWIKATSPEDLATINKNLHLDLKSFPLLAVLEPDGSFRESTTLSKTPDGKLDLPAVEAFLLKHRLPVRDADKILADALTRARNEHKAVFLQQTGTWCGYCRILTTHILNNKDIFDAYFVWIKIDPFRQLHGEQLITRLRKGRDGGIPWFLFLDSTGKEIMSSNMPPEGENCGCPIEPKGTQHFLTMLKSAAPAITLEQLKAIEQDLTPKQK